jgi:hypothetical protein
VGSSEADKRYEVILKHETRGVLHNAFFDDLNKAHAWLCARWSELRNDAADLEISYGGAVYDNDENHRRIFVLGTKHLV